MKITVRTKFDRGDMVTFKVYSIEGASEIPIGLVVDIQWNLTLDPIQYCVSFPNGKQWLYEDEIISVIAEKPKKPGFK